MDVIFHSDSLFSAVTSAMARLGLLEEWLDATARASACAVSFSSCFPFLDEIGFIVPPRTIWPPTSPGLMSARVRWKSARFVPLGILQSILEGRRLDENHWSVDGPSECLVPVGRPGPFRTSLRWGAAVDRLSGASERHSVACIEFRPGAGLWTIASFASESARDRWREPVMAAFRLLADSGFGGERSRGWGRSAAPEFTDGELPDMIVPVRTVAALPPESPVTEPPPVAPEPPVEEPQLEPPVTEPEPAGPPAPSGETAEPVSGTAAVLAPPDIAPLTGDASVPLLPPDPETEPPAAASPSTPAPEGGHEPVPPTPEPPAVESSSTPEPPAAEFLATPAPESNQPEPAAPAIEPPAAPSDFPGADFSAPVVQPLASAPEPEAPTPAPPAPEPEPPTPTAAPEAPTPAPPPPEAEPPTAPPAPEPEPPTPTAAPEPPTPAPPPPEPQPPTAPEPPPQPSTPVPASPAHAFWLLSLYSPASGDTVDWQRGNYTLTTRGGRIESPAGSGELKKQVQMVAEGSVLLAHTEPHGAAPDVAPDGFPHPVFRAGFSVAIPLPEVS